MVELIWTPSALNDINSIAEFIGKDSVQAAKTIVELFFEKAIILERFPLIGKRVPELMLENIRELLVSRYRLTYEIHSENQIHIITIHHQSRLLKNNKSIRKKLK